MRKIFTLLVALMASVWMVNAVTIEGIAYFLDKDNLTAEVTTNSYSGDIIIPEVVEYEGLEYHVTSIGDDAFREQEITSVIIPNSVISIGEEAFAYNYYLASITIGTGVTSIGIRAFGYNALTSVVIPESVVSIGRYAFENCGNLQSINIPETVTDISLEAFNGCTSLPVIDNIRYADSYLVGVVDATFSGYTIQEGTRYIACNAFKDCKSLSAITIPESVTAIGQHAFSGCTKLTSVTIPANVSYLESSIFAGCENMESITIERETPATLEFSWATPFGAMNACPIYIPCGTMEEYKQQWEWTEEELSRLTYKGLAFSISGLVNDEKMGSVIVPENACNLQISAVPNEGYHFVQWSDGVVTNPRAIELTQDTSFTAEFAFSTSGTCGKDNTLSWVYQPSSAMLAIIGSGELTENYTFSLVAKEMKTLLLGEGITILGSRAFRECTNLENVTLPNSLVEIEDRAFSLCSSLKAVTIPENVTKIGLYAFASCTGLSSIIVPERVENIEMGLTFYECTGLQSVEWKAKNAIISPDAEGNKYPVFQGANNITSFTFGDEVETIPYCLCAGLSELTEISIPSSVNSIGESAFEGCAGLTTITIPASVNSIGVSAFAWCSNLDTIRILNGNATIGSVSLYEDYALRYIEAPAGVLEADRYNYSSCFSSRLEKVIINGGTMNSTYFDMLAVSPKTLRSLDLSNAAVLSLEEEQFSPFRNLEELILPSSLSVIDYAAVADCYYIRTITIPEDVYEIGDRAFDNCRSLQSVEFAGDKVKRIGSWAFFQCLKLKDITIPEGVTVIGDAAFYGCAYLEKAYLPSSVQSIGDNAFALCAKLTSMEVDAAEPPAVEDKTFDEVPTTAPVYVPDASVDSYKSHPVWGKLNIIGRSDAPTAINQTNTDTKAVIILRDGQILILRGDHTFNLQGQLVNQ